VVVRFQFVDT